MKKELLAPAGDTEAGYAALYYGADAQPDAAGTEDGGNGNGT